MISLHKMIHGKPDEGDDDARDGHQERAGSREEELAHDDIQAARDGEDGHHGVARHAVGALPLGMRAAQRDQACEGERVEYPAREDAEVGEQVELPREGVKAGEDADEEKIAAWQASMKVFW